MPNSRQAATSGDCSKAPNRAHNPARELPNSPEVVSALSGAPRAEILAQRKETSRRGTFDRGDLKDVADSTRY